MRPLWLALLLLFPGCSAGLTLYHVQCLVTPRDGEPFTRQIGDVHYERRQAAEQWMAQIAVVYAGAGVSSCKVVALPTVPVSPVAQ